jgi:prepilin-type N-terminal cleavage/methylation domain-containing protein
MEIKKTSNSESIREQAQPACALDGLRRGEPRTPNVESGQAFTLMELLVVITIIAILMGLIFPVFQGVQNQAKKAQAKNDLAQIGTAVNAYYTEYGKYPVVADDTPIANTADLFYTLRAIASGTVNASDAANPRKIVFVEIPDAKNQSQPRSGIKTSDGQWYDPWGTSYKIAIDGNYDNTVANPYGPTGGAGSDPIRAGVISWSLGKDKQFGKNGKFTGSDDVISWQ